MGINGVSTMSNMTQNCGMANMHSNEPKKINNSLVSQSEQIKKIFDGVRGKKIDLEV
jgi:hypothetical protein